VSTAIEPEVLPKVDPWVERIAWIMDSAIPVGRWSIGLDGFLGLIPGFGDFVGALISMLIVARAVQAGIPRVAVARMLTNIAIDTLVGSIPVLGDAFDFGYKANLQNVRIYRESLRGRTADAARHWAFFVLVLLAIVAIGMGAVAVVVLVVRGIMK